MASGFQESATTGSFPSAASNSSNGTGGDSADFECNICFDLAQDPIVTLCGHLFCWPCLYRWLNHHSQSHECPVCKALVQEEKLVPLYGRGKTTTDPRSRPVPGVDIPNRPTGQRPETAPRPPPGSDAGFFQNAGFGLFGGFGPMATARFGNVTMSAGFVGLLPAIWNFQFHGFPEPAMYGAAHGYPRGYGNASHGGGDRVAAQTQGTASREQDFIPMVFLILGIFVIAALCGW